MIPNDSRYIEAAHEFATAHVYDEAGKVESDDEGAVIEAVRDTTYLIPTRYDTPPPLQYMASVTDNITLIAYRRGQQDPNRWWVVANANPHIRHPMDLTMGDMLNLPE